MTYTTFDEGCLGTTARLQEPKLPCLLSEIARATKAWIERSALLCAFKPKSPGAGLEPGGGLGGGLGAVSNYVQFIAAHPDMPRAHKDRFLGAIIRCCEERRVSGM